MNEYTKTNKILEKFSDKLPVKIGQKVYRFVFLYPFGSPIQEGIIKSIKILYDCIDRNGYMTMNINFEGKEEQYSSKDFCKSIFFTKKEAEQARDKECGK